MKTLLTNARIRTMDPARPLAEALVMADGRILAVGSASEMAGLGADRVIDAQGRLVLPGFQDAHIHLLNGGVDLIETAQLYDCVSLDEIVTMLAAHAAGWSGPMVWGAGWQCGFFGDHNLTRELIDRAVPDRPCLIYDGNFHNACLNGRAIELIGLTDDTPDPPNGHFVRDGAGRATGMLHEDAIYWATARLPKTAEDTLWQGMLAGQALANRHGITGVLDPAIRSYHRRIYARAANEGALTLRVAGAVHITEDYTVKAALDRLTDWRAAHPGPDFHVQSAKFFLDGGLENRTAAMLAPYADAPGGNAALMFSPDRIAEMFTAIDAARFQIHTHCIGDAAARAALDGFAAARTANGPWPGLHQIAHCQVVHPDDHVRFAELGVMANLQPLWAANDPILPDTTMAMIGPDRAPWTYPFRSLIDAGAPWCINSDWAVTTLNPFEIIGTAVTREPPRHRGRAAPFFPDQRMSVEQAVLGYTTHAAAASWRGHYSGVLRPGFSADLIVLDRNIFTCPVDEIAATQVLLTLFKGRVVHQADAA